MKSEIKLVVLNKIKTQYFILSEQQCVISV